MSKIGSYNPTTELAEEPGEPAPMSPEKQGCFSFCCPCFSRKKKKKETEYRGKYLKNYYRGDCDEIDIERTSWAVDAFEHHKGENNADISPDTDPGDDKSHDGSDKRHSGCDSEGKHSSGHHKDETCTKTDVSDVKTGDHKSDIEAGKHHASGKDETCTKTDVSDAKAGDTSDDPGTDHSSRWGTSRHSVGKHWVLPWVSDQVINESASEHVSSVHQSSGHLSSGHHFSSSGNQHSSWHNANGFSGVPPDDSHSKGFFSSMHFTGLHFGEYDYSSDQHHSSSHHDHGTHHHDNSGWGGHDSGWGGGDSGWCDSGGDGGCDGGGDGGGCD